MKLSTLACALLVSLGGVAVAQPTPPPEGTPDQPAPPPPPPPPAPPPPAPPPMHHHMDDMAEPTPDRPEGLAFGIGVGYQFNTSLETPNIVSVRVRMPSSGITLEPLVKIANDSTTSQTTPNPSTTDSTTELALGTAVRFPVIRRGRTDFEFVGVGVIDTVKNNPEGPNNDRRTTTFAVGWGIGIGYWITHHWQLSLTATNPLFSYAKTSTDNGPGMTNSTSETDIGVVFDPVVSLMIHLYN